MGRSQAEGRALSFVTFGLLPLIVETDTAYQALGGEVNDEKVQTAIQKAGTAAKKEHREAIHATLTRHEGTLTGKLGCDSAEYLEFFPQGLSEYRRAREAELAGLLARLVTAATVHAPELADSMTELTTQWTAVYGEAAAGRAETKDAAASRAEASGALRRQLHVNALSIVLAHVGEPERVKDFMEQSLLENRRRGIRRRLRNPPNATFPLLASPLEILQKVGIRKTPHFGKAI